MAFWALTPTLYAWFDDIGLWLSAFRRRTFDVAVGDRRRVADEALVAREAQG